MDYTEMTEYIKLSEIRVTAFTNEIKECEESIKQLNEEIEITKSKEKQLTEELVYKKKIVSEKDWELNGLKRVHNTWVNMLKNKQVVLESQEEELESLQNAVWNTRRTFHDKTAEFLSKYNIFTDINSRLETLIQKQQERNNLLQSIEALDLEVNSAEKIYSELKANSDLIQHLEKEKESLLEYEHSPEIIRIQNKIANSTKDIESLEKELSKYSERETMTPQELLIMQNYQEGNSQISESVEQPREPSINERRGSFKPKMPSLLIKRPSGNQNI